MSDPTPRQIKILRFFDAKPAPHRFAWMVNGKHITTEPPEKWNVMRVWRRVGSSARRISLKAGELSALEPWLHYGEITDAGRTALRAAEARSGSDGGKP